MQVPPLHETTSCHGQTGSHVGVMEAGASLCSTLSAPINPSFYLNPRHILLESIYVTFSLNICSLLFVKYGPMRFCYYFFLFNCELYILCLFLRIILFYK
jgi:hypothetical protein